MKTPRYLIAACALVGMVQLVSAQGPLGRLRMGSRVPANGSSPIDASRLPAGNGTVPNPHWAGAGVVAATRTTQCGSTIAAGASASTINTAISTCTAGQFVHLGTGSFPISAGLKFDGKSNVTLRGDGPNNTFVTPATESSCGGKNAGICVINSSANWVGNSGAVGDNGQENNADWTAGYAQGSTSITLSARTIGSVSPTVGTTLILDQTEDGSTRAQDTGNIFICTRSPECTQANGGNGRNGRAQQQLVTVTSVSGTGPYTLGISPPIQMPNWRSGQSPKAWWANANYVTGVGIEDLSIDCTACNPFGITFYNATNSWVKNVRSIRHVAEPVTDPASDKHILLFQSTHITVRDSYFFGRDRGDEYGVNIWETSDTLVENNIFQHIPLPILHESGYGTVAGYNYTINNEWNDGTWSQGSIYGHGGHEDYILAEGNDGFGFEMENYYGFSIFATSFRNRWTGFEAGRTSQTVPMFIYGLNRYANLVGNVVGTSGYHVKYQTVPGNSSDCVHSVFSIGLGDNCGDGDPNGTPPHPLNDQTTVDTLLRWGNWDVVTASARFVSGEVPSGISPYANPVPGSQTLPASYYLSAKPGFFGAKPWPGIGPEVSGGDIANTGGHANRNPARTCFEDVMGGTSGDTSPRTFSAGACGY